MRAGLRIDAFVSQPEPINGTAIDQVLLHNLRCIFRRHMPVPNCFGIHDYGRSVLALIQAEGLVDAHGVSQAGSLRQLLQLSVQFALSIGRTRGPWRAFRPGIMANKNVVLKNGQALLLQLSAYRARPGAIFPHLSLPTQPPSERMIA